MEVTSASARRRGMASLHTESCLSPSLGPAVLPRQCALRDAQTPLGKARCPQAGNRSAVGQDGKSPDPKIDTDQSLRLSPWLCRQRNGKTNGPSLNIPSKGAALDDCIGRHLPMQMYAQRSGHGFEPNPSVLQGDSGKLGKAKAIEPALASKARKTWFPALLHTPKKRLVCLVEAL